MKKVLIVIVLAAVLSMPYTAFADHSPGGQSITLTEEYAGDGGS